MSKLAITKKGHEKIVEELKQLKTIERPRVIKAIAEARSHGDLSENAEYSSARERQGFIEGQINRLEDFIRRAEIIDPALLSGDVIRFGATVTMNIDDKSKTYQIVGEAETNVKEGLLSVASPLGRTLISKSLGDCFEFPPGDKSKTYEIINVEYK